MAETANFDDAPIGSAPKGWTITMTGKGNPQWTVEKDDTAPSQANVLKQSGKATYPLALKDGTSIKNGFIAVKFKAISGSEDRAAGLVWRAVDANNYYVVRANALEDNVVLYKTVNGVRSPLDIVGRKGGYGVNVPVPAANGTPTGRICWDAIQRDLQWYGALRGRGCNIQGGWQYRPMDQGRQRDRLRRLEVWRDKVGEFACSSAGTPGVRAELTISLRSPLDQSVSPESGSVPSSGHSAIFHHL